MPKAVARTARTAQTSRGSSAKTKVHPHINPNRSPAEEKEEKVPVGSSLPMVSAIDDSVTMRRATELLKEAERIKKRNDEDAARLKEIRQELGVIADAFQMPGFRWGGIGFAYLGERTNTRLDVQKLIENGVDPEVIRQSYSATKPFIDSRLVLVHS